MANIPLLEKVLDHIHSDIEHWNQTFWRTEPRQYINDGINLTGNITELPVTCDTSFCFAGWAVQLAPDPVRWISRYLLASSEEDDAEALKMCDFDFGTENKAISVSDRAKRLLELDDVQADVLFCATNSLAQLDAYVQSLKDESKGLDYWGDVYCASRGYEAEEETS